MLRVRTLCCRLQFTLHHTTGKRSISLTALVTGGNRGIGLQVCKQLALNGHRVIMATRSLENGIAALQKHFDEDSRDRVHLLELDISDSSSISDAVQHIQSKYDSLDILVNNAGLNLRVSTNTKMMIKETLHVNYYGTMELTNALLPLLRKQPSQSSLSKYSSRIIMVSNRDAALKKLSPSLRGQFLNEELDETELNSLMEMYRKDALKHMEQIDCKDEDAPTTKEGWLACPYLMSYAGLNQYCRILGKRFADNNEPTMITAYCPGHCATDSTNYFGSRDTSEGAYGIYTLATMLLDDETISNGTFCSAFYSNNNLDSIELEIMDWTEPSQTVSWDALCTTNIGLEPSQE